ncbi:MAG: two-component system, NtrC family, response regulator [Blastocatellia bacterium]|jgi:ActR/RegA family two-component response regulator|nr:two-component system, NtrC family, response regulator [Blastocatellia bacterium]
MKPKLLIVDDDIAITQQLYWALFDYFDVTTANDTQTALRRLAVYEPAVAILDLQLSNISDSPEPGLQVLEFIKCRLPEMKVVILSSSIDQEIREVCLNGGADEVIAKPFKTDDLISALLRQLPPYPATLVM